MDTFDSYISRNKKMAVLFDIENVALEKYIENIFKELDSRKYLTYPRKVILNNLVLLKANSLYKLIKPYNLDLVCAYASSGKNVADFRLYIEALDLLYAKKELDAFCIVSKDADFSELVIKIKNEGKYVIGIGPKENANVEYISLFNEYLFLEDLIKTKTRTKKKKEPEIEEVIIAQNDSASLKEETTKKKTKKEPKKKELKAKRKVSSKKKTIETPINIEPILPEKIEVVELNKMTYLKDDKYYQTLKEIIPDILNSYKQKNQLEINWALLIKEIKNLSPSFLKNYHIKPSDIESIGFKGFLLDEKNPSSYSIKTEFDSTFDKK